jgi:RHS repeat-associated protein
VRQLVNNAGEVTLSKSYDPYGSVISSTGSGSSVYGYTGESQDAASGMVYLRSRYYNVADGRFQSRDTWGGSYNSPQSLNRWSYVEGNPISYTDPSGYWRWMYSSSGYHNIIESYYQGLQFSTKQLEFPIPGTPFRRADMFNSVSGDIYEIEPWYLQAAALPQTNGYVADLSRAAARRALSGNDSARVFL